MRISDRGSSPGKIGAEGRAVFDDALRRARAASEGAPRAEARGRAEGRPETRRTAARAPRDGEERRPTPGAEERTPAVVAQPPPGARQVEIPPAPELAALARALPVAVAAAGVRDGATLALSFGRSLDVELRTGATGIELLLRPEPRLERAAQAELPRLVAAMRIRGIAVGRAEVRTRGGGGRRAR